MLASTVQFSRYGQKPRPAPASAGTGNPACYEETSPPQAAAPSGPNSVPARPGTRTPVPRPEPAGPY